MPDETASKRARLLIADDEAEIRNVLYDLLSEKYECTAVDSAEKALATLRTKNINVVLSDVMMSGMTGLEFIPHAREASPNTLVILISGTQSMENAITALRLGAFDYIMKPFNLRHVEVIIERALEHYDLLQAKRRYENYLEDLVKQRTAELDRTLISLEDAYRSTLRALAAALETRDAETLGHCERVVSFSLRLGRELGISSEDMRALEFGALLHDIGKIGVPDAILRKPGKLTEEEWVEMRQHAALGQQILYGIDFLEGALRVVGQHHEKWDGSGYPLGLRGEEIDLRARIFSVADAFDAMISDRVYRLGRSYELAVKELDDYAGRQFDPRVVEAFHCVSPEEWKGIQRACQIRKYHQPATVRNVNLDYVKSQLTLAS